METITVTQLNPEGLREMLREELRNILKPITDHNQTSGDADDSVFIDEAAKILGLKVSTVHSKASRREIPHSKPGKHLRFSRKELLAYKQSKKRKTQAELDAEANDYQANKKG